jgi:Flp pilus assembly pilin Flp
MVFEGGAAAAAPRSRKAMIMTQVLTTIRRLALANEGQDLIEYGLLVALIAIVAVGAVTSVGNTIYTVFWSSIGQAV